jgi:hypothetical protein
MTKTKEFLEWEQNIIRAELKVCILNELRGFKSNELPGRKLKPSDVINVLSDIIRSKTS